MLYNSRLAKTVFDKNLHSRLSGTVIPITHYDLVTKVQHTKSSKIRVGYIGPNRLYKGFEEFVNLAHAMDLSKFEFHTFGYTSTEQIDHVIQHGRFAYAEIGSIFSSIDILIVPSLWKETFGFVVIEALANHCPVLISQNVGAKDLVPSSNVYKSLDDLKNKLYERLDEGTISPLNIKLQSMSRHASEVVDVYEEVISNDS
jgi:glycosyltransferase involved in cell wall biosynthesis